MVRVMVRVRVRVRMLSLIFFKNYYQLHGPRRLQHTHNSQWVTACTPHQPLVLRHEQVSGNSKNHSETSPVALLQGKTN